MDQTDDISNRFSETIKLLPHTHCLKQRCAESKVIGGGYSILFMPNIPNNENLPKKLRTVNKYWKKGIPFHF